MTNLFDSAEIGKLLEAKREQLIQASKQIWNLAELRFEEYESARLLSHILEENGFEVERGIAGIETAFVGSYGRGKPVIAILGEFDALSGLSQKAGATEEAPLLDQSNGHGCGHNLLGVGALGAALVLKELIDAHQLEGTIRYYGCPAEEGGSGKTYMVRDGAFKGVDVALTWHPGTSHSVMQGSTLANYQVYYRFKGKSSHAAISPHLGRSALDAIELMNVGVNYLREHVVPEARIHYAVTNTGGHSPNVVQAEGEVLYLIRAPEIEEAHDIYKRVNDIAKGAALMTGTKVEIVLDKACSNVIPNQTLNKIMHDSFREIGVPTYTEEEKAFAQQIALTTGHDVSLDESIAHELEPFSRIERVMSASTDVGDVSWVTPTAQCETACFAVGTPFHSWQMVSQSGSSIGQRGMLHASYVIALTALKLFTSEEMIQAVRAEWEERLQGKIYISPIPDDIKPPQKKRDRMTV